MMRLFVLALLLCGAVACGSEGGKPSGEGAGGHVGPPIPDVDASIDAPPPDGMDTIPMPDSGHCPEGWKSAKSDGSALCWHTEPDTIADAQPDQGDEIPDAGNPLTPDSSVPEVCQDFAWMEGQWKCELRSPCTLVLEDFEGECAARCGDDTFYEFVKDMTLPPQCPANTLIILHEDESQSSCTLQ